MDDERSNETKPMTRVQSRIGRPLQGYLTERYLEDGLTTTEIGCELGLSSATVRRWLMHFGVELRFPGQRGQKGCS
jgi:DNA-directed RNA polymerase specialized sigma24 family protein